MGWLRLGADTLELLIKYAIDIVLGIAAFFAIRALNKIDKNQDKLSDRLDKTDDKVDLVDTRLTKIETEHEILKPNHCKDVNK